MIDKNCFNERRRQPYLTYTAFVNTLKRFEQDRVILAKKLTECGGDVLGRTEVLGQIAFTEWFCFQIKHTAGVELDILKKELSAVVDAYEEYVSECNSLAEDDYYSPIALDDLMDTYVGYINLICFCILLHREDLIPRVYGLISKSQFDGDDAVIEELFKFFLENRPELDHWIWEKPYRNLLDAIDSEEPVERVEGMKKYIKLWYRGMKGQALFWGKHEKIKDTFSPYFGYWAMCAGAFTYLYNIDDSSYENELVYPKDLVDYARSAKRDFVCLESGVRILRVLGGQLCPIAGAWFSPAKEGSARSFKKDDLMPVFPASEYGETIWQWIHD
ncbi:DUF1911 domain-containing protein [Oxalobacteraceae sp. CFBP 8763]|nr:DUF1911 domain-containing protein [Oxalobacteraceae sp. CFBP 8763]